MIAGALAEQGIVIAFPQRDLHLHADRPIPVELVAAGTGAESVPKLTKAPSESGANAQ